MTENSTGVSEKLRLAGISAGLSTTLAIPRDAAGKQWENFYPTSRAVNCDRQFRCELVDIEQ